MQLDRLENVEILLVSSAYHRVWISANLLFTVYISMISMIAMPPTQCLRAGYHSQDFLPLVRVQSGTWRYLVLLS